MNENDRPILLLTCSGISHTGQLTTLTGNSLRYHYPALITRHLQLTALKRSLEQEFADDEWLIAVDGCEECCVKKRMDLIGQVPDAYIIATKEGISKRGMEAPRYDEIKGLSTIILNRIRNDAGTEEECDK